MRRRISKKGRSDDVQKEEGTSTPAQAVAVQRSLASQIEQAMNENRLTKAEMARRMETSRSQLNRLLDPDSESVTLDTLAWAAQAVGRRVRVELV
jgi:predicted XRE-type DNA-binding protein